MISCAFNGFNKSIDYYANRLVKSNVAENLVEAKLATRISDLAVAAVDLKDNQKRVFTVITEVQPDGAGDYFNGLNVAKRIKQLFPHAQVSFLAVYTKDRKLTNGLPKVKLSNFGLKKEDHFLLERSSEENLLLEEAMKNATCGKDLWAYPDSLLERLATSLKGLEQAQFLAERVHQLTKRMIASDIIIEVSVPMGDRSAKNYLEFLKKYQISVLVFNEYDTHWNAVSPAFYCEGERLERKPYKLGLRAQSKGILLPDLSHFKMCRIKGGLEDDYFCYQADPTTFIRFAVKASKEEQKLINLTVPVSKDCLAKLEGFFEQSGIFKATRITSKDGQEEILWQSEVLQEGKTLRVFNPFPLTHELFLEHAYASNLVVGCTGNNSVCEMISLNKVPVFERKTQLKAFWRELCKIAEEILPEGSPLPRFLDDPEKYAESIYYPAMSEEMKLLASVLKEHHELTPLLAAKLNKALMYKKSKALYQTVKGLKKSFVHGLIGRKELFTKVKSEFEKHSLGTA